MSRSTGWSSKAIAIPQSASATIVKRLELARGGGAIQGCQAPPEVLDLLGDDGVLLAAVEKGAQRGLLGFVTLRPAIHLAAPPGLHRLRLLIQPTPSMRESACTPTADGTVLATALAFPVAAIFRFLLRCLLGPNSCINRRTDCRDTSSFPDLNRLDPLRLRPLPVAKDRPYAGEGVNRVAHAFACGTGILERDLPVPRPFACEHARACVRRCCRLGYGADRSRPQP